MAGNRDFTINGESLVQVKGNVNSSISSLTDLGLSDGPIRVTPTFRHKDINVDAWGEAPADVQWMLSELNMRFTLIHVNLDALEECVRLSAGGALAFGEFNRAGTRMGNNQPRFAATNSYIGLNITSPVANRPWRFFYAYMPENPIDWPLGTEKSVITVTWRAVPYTQDPYNGGSGAAGYTFWDRNADT